MIDGTSSRDVVSFSVYPDPFGFTCSLLLDAWWSLGWWCGWGFLDDDHVLVEGLFFSFREVLLRFSVQPWVGPPTAPWFGDLGVALFGLDS